MRQTLGVIAGTVVVAGTVAVMAATAEPPTAGTALVGTAVAGQRVDARAGQKAYASLKCDQCHTIRGRGTKKKNGELDSVGKELTADEIRMWLTNTAEMEAKLDEKPDEEDSMAHALEEKEILPEEIDALVAYLQTLTR